jgi:hypothetical protein
VEVVPASDKGPSPERQPLAVGQVVLTATSVPGVDGVLLDGVDGHPGEMPLPGGALTTRPLRRSDYVELLRPRTPSPTPSSPTPTTSPTASKTSSASS